MHRERHDRPGGRSQAVNTSFRGDTQQPTPGAAYFEHFAARCVQDAINSGLAATWERRRAAFLAARPRAEDFPGRASREELRSRWFELTAIADACAARASVSLRHEDIDPDVWEVIAC